MCGIVGAIAQRNVTPILLEGLKRLEYRGYDSAGLAVINNGELSRVRRLGKVAELVSALAGDPAQGNIGIAHTRWATHGKPSEANAHPHVCNGRVAIVHNGIIENYESLKKTQLSSGYKFTSQTDTEVIAHQILHYLEQSNSLVDAVRETLGDLKGAYAIGVIDLDNPHSLIAARKGSPLVIGVGIEEYFIASDVQALLPVTRKFIYLQNGDIVVLQLAGLSIFDDNNEAVTRPEKEVNLSASEAERGTFRHFMLKEIYEQAGAIADTLEGRITDHSVPDEILGPRTQEIVSQVNAVQIIACGTSYHAGLVAKYWFEGMAGIPCHVEVASEFRYRKHVVQAGTLFVTISQSGETADTLAALMLAKSQPYIGTLTICNVPESSLVRESNLSLMTHAGVEIGVASTKAFTTQLVALLLMVIIIGRRHQLDKETESNVVTALRQLPAQIEHVLDLDSKIADWAEQYVDKEHALFLGRGSHYPIAMEGALKLKEISYIHAEAYAAGELKHGPLALVDNEMPVIAVAPNNDLLEKLESNLEEVRSRGGELYVFADIDAGIEDDEPSVRVMNVASTDDVVAPIVFTVPLQLLAYHTAVLKGTDIDQPRNLAKSVTVE